MSKSASRIITCSYNFWDMPELKNYSVPVLSWWTLRLCFYIAAALLFFGFMVWVPRSWNCFTRFGARTLQVYILHRFLYLADLKYEWWKPFNTVSGVWAMAGIALAVTIILSLKPFELPFTLLQSIKVKPFLKKAAETAPAAAPAETPAVSAAEVTAAEPVEAAEETVEAAEETAEAAAEAAAEETVGSAAEETAGE